MQVRCPHCHNPVEILDDSSLRDIECSSCGSSFSLVTDETVSFKRVETQTLGHFELIERIGVGAFGTVWKARDTELDRTVAIKIPRKEQLSERDSEQFFREARAAAQLKHPSIVGVHEVGRDGETIYIVSDYVQGLTLADWLTGQQPSIRESVQLIAKVTDALHAAHEKGIVHRDLKPSNIMLDETNEPHVMDFGLAKRETGEITMTVDGQVLGTPAYMAPEQARGDAHQADRRADIYSLGVILFELLTGEKPFRGNTRMLLHQVLSEDAPSPRRLNSNVPRDLETITLRCLEKEPTKRFRTADDFGADLRRFLQDEPVVSRPIGKVERGLRWCKRNPTVATLTVAIAVLLVGGITVVSALWIRAENNAEQAAQFAVNYREEATKATNLATREKKARQEAEAEKKRADANFERAQDVVDEFFTEVSESRELLSGAPGTQELRRRLLEKAEEYYETFLTENDQSQLKATLALARVRLGKLQYLVGKTQQAKETLLQALDDYRGLAKDGSHTHLEYRIAECHLDLGSVYATTGERHLAEQRFNEAINTIRLLIDGSATVSGHHSTLAKAHTNLGVLLMETGEATKALEQQQHAVELLEQLVDSHPTEPCYQDSLAHCHVNLAFVYDGIGEPGKAIEHHEIANRILGQLVKEDSSAPEYQATLGRNLVNLGVAHLESGNLSKATATFEQAREVLQRLVDQNPSVATYRHALAGSHSNLGMAHRKSNDSKRAAEHWEHAATILKRLVDEHPDVPEYQRSLLASSDNLGLCYRSTGNFQKAAECHSQSIQVLTHMVSESPEDIQLRTILGGACVNLAIVYGKVDNHTKALDTLVSGKHHLEVVLERNLNSPVAKRFLFNARMVEARTLNARAWILATSLDDDVRNGTQAVSDATKACELSEWKNWSYIGTLAAAHAETGNFDEAVKQQKRAIGMAPDSSKAELEARLKLYMEGKPYREPVKKN